LPAAADRAHNPPMTQVSCQCGATYEVIETKGPSHDDDTTMRCALCGKELFCWSGSDVGQLRLVTRPESDRE
jgi:predicted SprT family Zn-dependent metalloprotease